ncbi:MAG TPA: hypothetical protein PLD23_06775 [Armatimonadota bacterium]|nr:hypothetical protein [Armatimonadota bacterium]HQK93190.1 hypothetical protein [Armatimonadota bacterium]
MGICQAVLRAAIVLVPTILAGCNPVGWITDQLETGDILDKLAGETRIQYTVQMSGGAAIAGATMSFYALTTGGDFTNIDDWETVADASVTTGSDGTVIVRVLSSPNEAGDAIVRPETHYRIVYEAPGFRRSVASQAPYDLNTGLKSKTLELTPETLSR